MINRTIAPHKITCSFSKSIPNIFEYMLPVDAKWNFESFQLLPGSPVR